MQICLQLDGVHGEEDRLRQHGAHRAAHRVGQHRGLPWPCLDGQLHEAAHLVA